MAAFQIFTKDNDILVKNKYGLFSRNELIFQIRHGRFTIKEIGEIYNLKDYQMKHLLNCLKIYSFNNIEDTRVSNPTITPAMHQVFLGPLLGDSSIKENIYSASHSIKQYKYCYNIAEKLAPFVSSIIFENKKYQLGYKECVTFWTHHHSVIAKYYDKFYSKGAIKNFLHYRPSKIYSHKD